MQKLQEATLDVERLGELFLINKAQASACATGAVAAGAAARCIAPLQNDMAQHGRCHTHHPQQLVEADRQRQANREALAALRRGARPGGGAVRYGCASDHYKSGSFVAAAAPEYLNNY